MNKVLTAKEYSKLKKKPLTEKTNAVPASGEITPALEPKKEKPEFEYLLLHPENPADQMINKIMCLHVMKEGKEKLMPIPIVNGQVKTTDKDIRNRLLAMGYEPIAERKINPGVKP